MNAGMLPAEMSALSGPILLAVRLGGVFFIAPVFAARTVPTKVRVALIIVFGFALYPISAEAAATLTVSALLTETLVGVLLGTAAALFVGAAEMAGEWLAVEMGLAGATTINPASTESTPVLGNFLSMVAIVLLLGIDGHLVMIEALASSIDVVPLGADVASEGLATSTVVLGTSLFRMGLRFAAPAIAVLMTVNVALGILARTVPQINMLMVAFPVQIGLGLMALALGMPLLSGVFGSWPLGYEGLLADVFREVTPTGPVSGVAR